MRRRYLSLCMAIALTLTSVFPYGAAAEEVIPTPAVEAVEEAETVNLGVNALDETEAPAAEAPTGEDAEAQEQEDAQASVNEEDAQTVAEEQTSMSAEDAQASEPAQIALPEESFDEEEAIVGDAEELPSAEATEDADDQDTDTQEIPDEENVPFDTTAINLADSQISVEAASIEADPMLAEEELSEEDKQDFFITAVDSTELRGDGWTWLYTEGEDSVTLKVEGEGIPEDASVTWDLGYWTEDDFAPLENALLGSGSEITLTGAELAALEEDENVPRNERSKYYVLRATVSAEDSGSMVAFFDIEARDPMHKYRLPYEVGEKIILLPEWEIYVDGQLDFYIDDAEHPDPNPYDDEVNADYPDSVQVTNVEVSLPDGIGEDECECDPDDEGNWHIKLHTPCEEGASF